MDVFDRYAPFVQDFIYRNNWESLRAIQVAAGDAIFNTQDNLLLCASTASGKTEAAFFPILTLFNEDPPASVGALYIGPLKALINDQFSRLNDLCAEADIPVWHWHGDVNQSHKNKLLKKPSGILQITPESLEALMLHKHGDIARLFGDLRFIVVDEVHSLMRGDRGGQTLCLMERLSRMVESRGFLLASAIALKLNAGVAICRKKGKLPGKTVEENFEKEYGRDTVCITCDAITSDDVVLIHDDLLATGGSLKAAYNLVNRFHPKKIYINVIIELTGEGLQGRKLLENITEVTTLIKI